MPEVRFGVNECIYGWTAAYRQDGTQVTVRIKLQPDADVDAATLADCRSRWRAGSRGRGAISPLAVTSLSRSAGSLVASTQQ